MSTISDKSPTSLHQAYLAAWYRVFIPSAEAKDLYADQHSDWLAQAYALQGVSCACYLTACNPQGERLNAARNAKRMRQLRSALQAQGWQFADGKGLDPEGLWPAEDSVLIWGMDAAQATQWGQDWQQNAVLWCGPDAIPRLLWVR